MNVSCHWLLIKSNNFPYFPLTEVNLTSDISEDYFDMSYMHVCICMRLRTQTPTHRCT